MGSIQEAKSKLMEPQELIAMARQLGEKLKSHDISATELLIRGRSIQRREEAIQELHSTLSAHSAVSFLGTTRPEVIRDLQHERRVLLALRQENEELMETVQENGDAIQYVMKKYRQHSKKLCDLRAQDAGCLTIMNRYLGAVVRSNVEDLEDMIYLTQQAVERDDIAALDRTNVLQGIGKENLALRSALNITPKSFGTPQIPVTMVHTSSL